jgi:hypothetical protein
MAVVEALGMGMGADGSAQQQQQAAAAVLQQQAQMAATSQMLLQLSKANGPGSPSAAVATGMLPPSPRNPMQAAMDAYFANQGQQMAGGPSGMDAHRMALMSAAAPPAG